MYTTWDSLFVNTVEPEPRPPPPPQTYTSNNTISFNKPILDPQGTYILFHKTLPRSIIQMHWISVRFYEMGDISFFQAAPTPAPQPCQKCNNLKKIITIR